MANSTTNLDLISSSQASKEVTANALFDAESPASLYGRRASATANLTWGYYGGMLAIAGTPTAIANGTKTLTNGATNYVEADPTTGNVAVNTSNFTAANIPLYAVVTAGNLVTSYTDYRALAFGKTALASPLGNATFAGIVTWTAVGTQEVISQDASIFREGQQSTMNSGTAYSTNGNLPIMKIWMHNTGINPSTGNFTAADATDYCTALIYSEDDKLKGFSSAAAVTAGNTPTLSNTWYANNITGAILSLSSGGIGYGLGAGGTVTQATTTAGSFVVGYLYTIVSTGTTDFTLIGAANSNPGTVFTATGAGTGTGTANSKFTAVTLNKTSGTVSTNTASLAAGAVAYFDMNNSTIASTDGIAFSFISTNIVNYSMRHLVAAGKVTILLKNESGGALTDAVTLSFQVIKGVTA